MDKIFAMKFDCRYSHCVSGAIFNKTGVLSSAHDMSRLGEG